jgi:RNA polymerase sigma-70 factor (ECF subfamily)
MLMSRYAAGDHRAFDELFERYEPRAYGFFLKRTGSPSRAEDLYQELFLRIHLARDRYDPKRAFEPWFFQIANHLLIDDRRRVFRSHEVPIEDRDPCSEAPGSEAWLADRDQVDQLLDALSPEERYAVLSAKVEGVGYSELADHLGKSVDAVKKSVSRAILRLRSTAAIAEGERIGVRVG